MPGLNITSKALNSVLSDDLPPFGNSPVQEIDIPPITLAILILLANGLVIFLVARTKPLRTETNLLLCSLALSDLLTGVISIPLFLMCNLLHEPALCIADDQMLRFTSVSTVCHLVAVSMDRYLAIIHSLRYKAIVTLSRCVSVMLCIWVLSATMALVQLSWMDPVQHDIYEDPSTDLIRKEKIYDVTCILAFIVAPLLCMVFVYAKIFAEVSRQIELLQKQNTPSGQKAKELKYAERKVVTTFSVMLLVYTICWLPYFVLRLHRLDQVHVMIIYLSIWLRLLTSFLNPCLYIFGKKDFRAALKWSPRKQKRCQYGNLLPLDRVGASG